MCSNSSENSDGPKYLNGLKSAENFENSEDPDGCGIQEKTQQLLAIRQRRNLLQVDESSENLEISLRAACLEYEDPKADTTSNRLNMTTNNKDVKKKTLESTNQWPESLFMQAETDIDEPYKENAADMRARRVKWRKLVNKGEDPAPSPIELLKNGVKVVDFGGMRDPKASICRNKIKMGIERFFRAIKRHFSPNSKGSVSDNR
jgi:hypothetical protein